MIRNYSVILLVLVAFSCGGNKEHNDDGGHDEMMTEHSEAKDAEDLFVLSEGQRVFFVNLQDGDVLTSPFTVEMGVEGMEVEPAGEEHRNKGHHHILIGEKFTPVKLVVAADSTHIHFGKGQTETELNLAPGKYVIGLQFANGFHQSYGEQMSTSIEIEVIK